MVVRATITAIALIVAGCGDTPGGAAIDASAGDDAGLDDAGVDAPPEARAEIWLNEVSAAAADGCDLIELRAVTAGTIEGLSVRENDSTIATFGAISLDVDALVVVHLGSGGCNPTGAIDETDDPAGQPAATHPQNFDTAIDVYSNVAGLTETTAVFSLRDASGYVDALLAYSSCPAAAATVTEANAVVDADQWERPQSGAFDASNFCDAVTGDGLNITIGGLDQTAPTLQRRTDTDTDIAFGDWTDAAIEASSFGALNDEQSPL